MTELTWDNALFALHEDGKRAVRYSAKSRYWAVRDSEWLDMGGTNTATLAENGFKPARLTTAPDDVDTLDGRTIYEWKSKWEAAKRHAQEVEEAISRRNAENKQLRIEKWEHRDVVDGKTAQEWKEEAKTSECAHRTQQRIIDALEAKAKDPAALIQAAWDAAHPVPVGAVLPAYVPHISRDYDGICYDPSGYSNDLKMHDRGVVEYRTLAPLTKPEPEWASAPYVWADHDEGRVIYAQYEDGHGQFWAASPGGGTYSRAEMASRNPAPVKEEE